MTTLTIEQVTLCNFEATTIAQLTHVGSPHTLIETIGCFIKWRQGQTKSHRPPLSATYNIIYDDPAQTPSEQYRFGIACSTVEPVAQNSVGVTNKLIPAGRCARIKITGSEDDMARAIDFLYRDWLVNSDEELRDFPLFVKRVAMFPDVARHQQEFEIYLPLM